MEIKKWWKEAIIYQSILVVFKILTETVTGDLNGNN
ncbi:hypothetical protein LFLEISCH_15599, partial [Listeria fleischmannii subsp. fleischmannii LU2006-1]